ncbi:DUF551 domain-containing protein [Acinetobacter baumannii]|uniref:DUF551 domain-containing protein n=1 Tax=Acinetobacter baumannii TaxID=470 RepID=UPI001EE784B3|nr:DUF551 domain-containing protein [Acinetobacter baumannii]MCG5792290.1 DUF551 domain-containing protein [Acinetobacter baumannii]
MIDLNQELEDFDAYFFKRHGELPLDPTSEEYANKSYLKHEMFKAWKARAKAQVVPEWISVKDGLPSYEESVLIKTNKGSVQGYLFQDEEYSEMKGEYMKLDCWQDEFHDDFIEYSDVTHWMPLPTALSESGAEQ